MVMAQAKISEQARERETFRYGSNLIKKSYINDAIGLSNAADLSSSSDTALTAFAQLGALRLGAQRCMISLFDQARQHIVAEATPDSALGSNEGNVLGHKSTVLLLSGTAIPRSYGVCDELVTYDEQPPLADNAMKTTQVEQRGDNLPVLVVRDLQSDERFNKRGWVRESGHGFYAGVPIRTDRGINIGVYCILGDKPRDGIDSIAVHFLQGISRTVMSYLSSRLADKNFQRSVRMVRGLGSLVEGKGSMAKWWLEGDSQSFEDADTGEGSLNSRQQAIQRDEDNPIPRPVSFPRHMAIASPLDPQTRKASPATPVTNDSNDSLGDTSYNKSDNRSDTMSQDGSVMTGRFTPRSITDPTTTATFQPEDESTIAIKSLFSKASNIIRESIEVEGVLFLDAVISSFGGLVVRSGEESHSTSGETFTSSGESSREIPLAKEVDVFCNVLGFSVGTTSSIDGEESAVPHSNIHEKFLKGLLRRYPQGHIFNFDANGSMQSGDSEDDPSVKLDATVSQAGSETGQKRRKPRKAEGEVLIGMFSRARSVALIPLWDSHKERWFSGGFAWTQTPTRVFSVQGELSYLKALGMVVMSEVARINTLRADQAKADVLGSLSHELRSPLHGLILGAELLHDTVLDGFQEDVVLTIENCGRTLADTMDHLLDFSKVNHSAKVSKGRHDTAGRVSSMQRHTRAEAGPASLLADVNLASLAEEVIESVYAGFSFQKASNTLRAGGMPLTTAYAIPIRRFNSLGTMDMFRRSSAPRHGPVVVVQLNIDSGLDWSFHTQPGALRRVIMNLFGNALKYTARGSIDISLTQDSSTRTARSRRRAVVLTISDTGRGISQEYLRTQLFSPFSQEDHLAPGVGLGLSLVKQIISTLKGTIAVDSEVGRGTVIKVTLPLRQSRSNSLEVLTPAESDFLDQAKVLKGVGICLTGFPDSEDAIPAPPLLGGERLTPKPLMEAICRSWLHMDVISEDNMATASPSLLVCPEDALQKVESYKTTALTQPPVVVICRNAVVAHELAVSRASDTRIFEYISQPAGPRKLSKVFALALKRHGTLLESGPKVPELAAVKPKVIETDASQKQHHPVAQAQDLTIKSTPVTPIPSQQEATQPESSGGTVGDSAPPSDPKQDKRIAFLLVDDNAINLKVLISYMNKLNRPYETAMNGLEALEAFRQNPDIYRCIFMDVSMPIMDGLEAARLIRAFEQQQNLPPVTIVALTGLGSSSAQEEAFASGINLFLTKPVRLKELGRVLEDFGM